MTRGKFKAVSRPLRSSRQSTPQLNGHSGFNSGGIELQGHSIGQAGQAEGDLFLGLNLRAGNIIPTVSASGWYYILKGGYPMEGMIRMNLLTGFNGSKKYETG